MKNLIIHFFVLIVGVLIGGTYIWVSSYSDPPRNYDIPIKLKEVLKYSNTQITDDNFSCEGETQKNVGSVIGSIYEMNNKNIRNMVTFDCFESTCTLSLSYCKPWQSQECGSRFLKFDIGENNKIDPTSFLCMDIP